MSDFINTIDVLGDDVVADSFLEKTLTEYKDNVITNVREYVFSYFPDLTVLDLPSVTSIANRGIMYCNSLVSLILRSETLCTSEGSWNFNTTPIKSGTGYIYVPSALVDSYKTATNWSTYANQFRALEDYTVDGTITGELDETKI